MKKKIIICLGILLSVVLVHNIYAKTENSSEYELITVKKGETLWSIAEEYCQNAIKTDTRKLVYTIKTINNLETSVIKPGDKLYIP